jgi:hypothetical protein
LGAVQFDVGGGLDASGDQAQQIAVPDQLWQERLDAGKNPVVLGVRVRLL